MTRFSSSLVALPLALIAGACSSSFESRYQAALPIEQRHPIEVKAEVTTLAVGTDTAGRLTGRSQSEVAGFLQGYNADGGTTLEIQSPSSARWTKQTEGEVREIAALYGVPSNRIRVTQVVPGPGDYPGLKLAYGRYVASVPSCENPDWSENLAMTWDNTSYSNLGCSMQKNMAAMAADPRDLVRARPLDPVSSSERRDAMVGKYEKGESPSSERTKGDSGKLAPTKSGTERE